MGPPVPRSPRRRARPRRPGRRRRPDAPGHRREGRQAPRDPGPRDARLSIRTAGDLRDAGVDDPLVDRSARTPRRWVTGAADALQERSGDDRWRFLSFHDLRRTWAGHLAAADVDEQVALRWGGWADLDTFLEHYRGSPTPEEQRRERDRVEWL